MTFSIDFESLIRFESDLKGDLGFQFHFELILSRMYLDLNGVLFYLLGSYSV